MPIQNIASRVSDEQRQQAYNRMNPPEYENGFEPSSGSSGADDFDSLGDDIFGPSSGDMFASSSGDSFGGSSDLFGSSPEMNVGDPFSSSAGFGSSGWGDMSGFNQGFNNQQTKEQPKDNMDKAIDYSAESLVSMGRILVDLVKSAKNRSLDDWALIGNRCIIIGVVVAVISIILAIIGLFSGFSPLRFVNLPATCLAWGLTTLSTGLICLSSMVLLKLRNGEFSVETQSIDDMPSATSMASSFGDEFDNSYDSSAFDDLDEDMSSLLDDILSANDSSSLDDKLKKDSEPKVDIEPVKDPEEIIKNLKDAPLLNRKYLLDNLIPFFPQNTPDFSHTEELESNGDEYLSIVSFLHSAIASACNKDEDDINLTVKKIESTKFCYVITFERDASFKKTNPDTLKAEIVNYFKSDADDNTVTAQLKVMGGDYICILSKGESAVITMGDCFKKQDVLDFYYNEKNRLPFIMGVDELGKVWMEDAGNFPSMMIVGIARSGKSWYVNSFILSLAAFNTPETVQFLVIDPKDSFLFKTIGYLPHCCGVHNHHNILAILNDILNVEAPRRKQLLLDHRCDTIWELRRKTNIQLPFLYVVIDEVMTVIKSLEQDGRDKEFLNMIIQIITQLPSLGIGILIVPHRAQGVVDKTTRSQMQFRAAVRAGDEVIKETLDVSKWDRPLIKPGDIALINSALKKAIYVRGTGVTLSDEENVELITNLSRAYYKMGVEIPDMSTIGCGYNRDMEKIKEELQLSVMNKTQFDIDA